MRIIAILFALLIVSSPARAEQKILKSGMQHLVVSKEKSVSSPPSDQNASFTPSAEEETKTKAIWDKYKMLASGTYEEESEPAEKEESKVQTQQTEEQTASSPAGLAGIISEYRKNKKEQGQLRTLKFTQPVQHNAPDETAKP